MDSTSGWCESSSRSARRHRSSRRTPRRTPRRCVRPRPTLRHVTAPRDTQMIDPPFVPTFLTTAAMGGGGSMVGARKGSVLRKNADKQWSTVRYIGHEAKYIDAPYMLETFDSAVDDAVAEAFPDY